MAKVKAIKSKIEGKAIKVKKKNKKILSDAEVMAKNFILLVVIMIVLVIGVYFFSKYIVDKRNDVTNNESVPGEIDYDITSVGTLLNRPYDEYYVMVYDSKEPEAVYYSSLITKYQAKKDALKIYFCDLGNSLNSAYKATGEDTNVNAIDVQELKFGPITLLKVKNGKINKAYEEVEKIKAALQ